MWNSRVKTLLRPGLGLKRWLALLLISLTLFSLGSGFAMAISISPRMLPVLRTLTLGAFPPMVRGAVFIVAGLIFGGLAAYHIYKWTVTGASQRRGSMDILTAVDIAQHRGRGPRIVAIGGGTGVSTILRGLKRITGNLTAIVTIADDGGSSGRLRDDLGMPALGDARNCLIALSESGPLMEELFDYRFNSGSNLNGHSLGNLLLAALYDGQGGMQAGLEAAAQLLSVSGRVMPVSDDNNLVIMGETIYGHKLRGESEVGHAPDPLLRVWIEPEEAFANLSALLAIQQADMIIIGPGSLYTSIIPNFLIPDIREAVIESKAPKIFVCNIATQPHETDGYGVKEHLKVFQAHSSISVSHILINSNVRELPKEWDQVAVPAISKIDGFEGVVILTDLVDDGRPTRHDPQKVAQAIMRIAAGPSKVSKI
jgi:uncharacterized cofD-like protein